MIRNDSCIIAHKVRIFTVDVVSCFIMAQSEQKRAAAEADQRTERLRELDQQQRRRDFETTLQQQHTVYIYIRNLYGHVKHELITCLCVFCSPKWLNSWLRRNAFRLKMVTVNISLLLWYYKSIHYKLSRSLC